MISIIRLPYFLYMENNVEQYRVLLHVYKNHFKIKNMIKIFVQWLVSRMVQ